MSEKAWAYVAGGAGEARRWSRTVGHWTAGRSCRGCCATSRSAVSPSTSSANGCPRRCWCPRWARADPVARNADVTIGKRRGIAGLPYIFSNQGSAPMEDVAAAMDAVSPGAPRWFQLYWSVDEQLVDSFLNRAEAMGAGGDRSHPWTRRCSVGARRTSTSGRCPSPAVRASRSTRDPRFRAIVDERVANPDPTRRRRSRRSGRSRRWRPSRATRRATGGATSSTSIRARRSRRSWRFIRGPASWPTSRTCAPGRPADRVEGCLAPRRRAARGRHRRRRDHRVQPRRTAGRRRYRFDRRPVDVVDAVGGRTKILVDSGVHTGSDVFKALALGLTRRASAGRTCTGWPSRGNGVREVLTNIAAELDLTLGLSGHTDVAALDRGALKEIG